MIPDGSFPHASTTENEANDIIDWHKSTENMLKIWNISYVLLPILRIHQNHPWSPSIPANILDFPTNFYLAKFL